MRSLFSAFSVAVCLLLLIAFGVDGLAQGILVTPARLETLIPSDGVLPSVFVQNRTSEPVAIHTETGWVTHDLYGNPIYLRGDADSLVLVHVEPAVALLRPGDGAHLHMSVHPTDRAVYPVLFVSFEPPGAQGDHIMRIAVPVLLHTGTEERRMRVEGVALAADHGQRHTLTAIVVNEGEAHFRTEGRVQVVSADGNVAIETELPEVLVLPGARRLVTAEWDAAALDWGEYRVVLQTENAAELNVLPIRFAVGPDGLRQLPSEGLIQVAWGESAP